MDDYQKQIWHEAGQVMGRLDYIQREAQNLKTNVAERYQDVFNIVIKACEKAKQIVSKRMREELFGKKEG